MTRVALYLNTDTVPPVDLRNVDAGNPGMGGSEYMFFLIARHLAEHFEVSMYVTRLGTFPEGITYHVVTGLPEAARHFDVHGVTMLILRESEILPNRTWLGSIPQRLVVWAHNFSGHKTLRACAHLPNLGRYVCVSREQYENLRDEEIFERSWYVYNAVAAGSFPAETHVERGKNVFYMGSIIEQKGFHVLARNWAAIKAQVPEARLHIVGSGQLYDRSSVMGPLGIAEASYERRFAGYISTRGVLNPDVVFHGTVGAEKLDLLAQAKVAVVNPTGVGETFCISALEFELLGVPVITRNYGGPKNVVKHGITGLLYTHEKELPGAVVRLLTDEALWNAMSQQAPIHARRHFDIGVVVAEWVRLLRAVESGTPQSPDLAMTEGNNGVKRIKEWNRRLKARPALGWLPSVDYWIHFLKKKRHSLITKPLRRLGFSAD